MINFQVKSNIPSVIDYVNQMHNGIESIISNAIEMAKIEIENDLFSVFGVPTDDLYIDFTFDGRNYKLTIDGINQYQLYNNTGYDIEFVFDYVESKMFEKIQNELNEAGYGN